MTRTLHRTLLVHAAAVVLAGCGQAAPTAAITATGASPTGSDGASVPDAPVLRVEEVGGSTTASTSLARVPAVSVYADGRTITETAPATTSSDGAPPALPSLVVHDVGPDGAARLVRLARDAGVGADLLLGRPGIADATTTRFTVVIDGAEVTTEAYALRESVGNAEQDGSPGPDIGLTSDLTPAQDHERQRLADLRGTLTDVEATLGAEAGPAALYQPSALAVLVGGGRAGRAPDPHHGR